MKWEAEMNESNPTNVAADCHTAAGKTLHSGPGQIPNFNPIVPKGMKADHHKQLHAPLHTETAMHKSAIELKGQVNPAKGEKKRG